MATTMASATQKLLTSLDPRKAGELCRELLAAADVQVNGDRPWDVQIHDERVWSRILRDGTLGAGESYVEGWWDTPALDQFIDRVQRVRLADTLRDNWMVIPHVLRARVLNLQGMRRTADNAQRHYDIGNDLYEAMLDARMQYTCALYDGQAKTLEQAQEDKLELVCRKVGLQKGMRVLELGCGWGGFAKYAAERHGVSVVGYNVSEEQVKWARERCANLPIEIRLDDYRKATGQFDAVVSIGLMEHVGPKNYRAYFELVDKCLAPNGVGFVHTIAGNRARPHIDPWFDKYIFPNAVLPTLAQLVTAMEGVFIPEDVHNIGEDYDPTLMEWWHRFDAAWPKLRARYGDAFYRMWKFYLLASAGSFRSRSQQLFQLVFTRRGTAAPKGRRG
ncbi:MAG TPA: cyclopropane fatty acyl phospholipid synthase [Kofleriaceae bacterium]|nr:cyclopropane fatty acyl phospholipid synthase [Kofleriaceae bacterium]